MLRVFVDSGSSIKQNEKDIYNVDIIPLKINLGGKEYDDEERFKNDILNIINRGAIIGKVWIKEEPDNYNISIKL